MAFNSAYLSLLSLGRDNKLFYYDAAAAGTDTLATINTAGYFNNTDDNIRMADNDIVVVVADDGVATLEVTAVSSGSVTTRVATGSIVTTGTTTANLAATGIIQLTSTTAGTHNLAAPTAGDRLTIIGTGVASHVISTTASVQFGSTGATTVTLGSIGSGVELLATSSTKYLIVGDVKSTTGSGYALS